MSSFFSTVGKTSEKNFWCGAKNYAWIKKVVNEIIFSHYTKLKKKLCCSLTLYVFLCDAWNNCVKVVLRLWKNKTFPTYYHNPCTTLHQQQTCIIIKYYFLTLLIFKWVNRFSTTNFMIFACLILYAKTNEMRKFY